MFSAARLLNSTVVANSAPDGANLSLAGFDDTRILRSTIVSDPLGGGENCAISGDASPSQGYNLADDASCRLTATGDQPGTDPKLGPLADNGGPTPTMALAQGSPAIDKGISGGLTTDQRGLKRPVDFPWIPNAPGGDGSDIGAFEVQTLPPPPPPNGGPSNDFSFGKVKKNKKRGTAKLTVTIPGPGELDLARTKKVKRDDERAGGAGEVKLKIKPKRKSKRKLRKKGKAKVKAEVTYTPDGGDSNTESKKLKLIKK